MCYLVLGIFQSILLAILQSSFFFLFQCVQCYSSLRPRINMRSKKRQKEWKGTLTSVPFFFLYFFLFFRCKFSSCSPISNNLFMVFHSFESVLFSSARALVHFLMVSALLSTLLFPSDCLKYRVPVHSMQFSFFIITG